MPALHDWQNFYLLTGTAAATLIGLLFITLSIGVGLNLGLKRLTNAVETFVTPVLLSYGQAFLISCLGVIPFQSALILGLLALVLGSANVVLAIRVALRIILLHRDEMDKGHWVWHALLPFLAGTLLIGAALGIFSQNTLALAGLALADLTCLVVGIRNSWALTIWLVIFRTQGSDASAAASTERSDAAALVE